MASVVLIILFLVLIISLVPTLYFATRRARRRAWSTVSTIIPIVAPLSCFCPLGQQRWCK